MLEAEWKGTYRQGAEMKQVRVVLVDDHPPVRDGLKGGLLRDRGIELAGEAEDGEELFRILATTEVEVVVLDISLPDYSGIELTRILGERHPGVRALVLSMYNRIDYILEALANGARGYMTKESSPYRLAEAVRRVAEGEYYFDQAALEQLVHKAQEQPRSFIDIQDSGYEQLTAREQEVMRLLAQGIPVKRIGQSLYISYRTVENHRTNIYKKLKIKNDAELVHYATRIGVIDFE